MERNEARRAVQKRLIATFRGRSTSQRQLRSNLVAVVPSLWRGWVDGSARVPYKFVSLIHTCLTTTDPSRLNELATRIKQEEMNDDDAFRPEDSEEEEEDESSSNNTAEKELVQKYQQEQ